MTENVNSVPDWVIRKAEWPSERFSEIVSGLIYVNVRSLHKNWDAIQVYLDKAFPSLHVLILTEINVTESQYSQVSLTVFKFFRLCKESRRGDGVVMFVRNGWQCARLKIDFNEAVAIPLSLNKDNEVFLSALYTGLLIRFCQFS